MGKDGEEERVRVRVEDRHEARLRWVWIWPFLLCLWFLGWNGWRWWIVDPTPPQSQSLFLFFFFRRLPYGPEFYRWALAQQLSTISTSPICLSTPLFNKTSSLKKNTPPTAAVWFRVLFMVGCASQTNISSSSLQSMKLKRRRKDLMASRGGRSIGAYFF